MGDALFHSDISGYWIYVVTIFKLPYIVNTFIDSIHRKWIWKQKYSIDLLFREKKT